MEVKAIAVNATQASSKWAHPASLNVRLITMPTVKRALPVELGVCPATKEAVSNAMLRSTFRTEPALVPATLLPTLWTF